MRAVSREPNGNAPDATDRVVRAMTSDGAFRVLTAITTETVRDAVHAQEARGPTADRLGQLITGAILLRETISPDRRVQVLVKDRAGRTNLVADAHPDGRNRGIVRPGADQRSGGGDDAILEVIHTLPNGIMHQGLVQLPDSGDLSAALMTYLHESEQIVATIAVATATRHAGDRAPGDLRVAGGYLVQLMPDAEREALGRMTESLEATPRLTRLLTADQITADGLREALVGTISIDRMSETALRFGCSCTRASILSGLATLEPAELEDMIAAGKPLDIQCDSCRQSYRIGVAELRALVVRLAVGPADDDMAN